MSRPRVLLIVDRPDVRVGYEMILRFCGYEPVVLNSPGDLQASPADVGMGSFLQADVGVFSHCHSGLRGGNVINQNVPAHDHCLSLLARVGEAPFHHEPVNA